MLKKCNVLLTFDYEIFLGRKSGVCQKVLIEPTEQILSVLKKYKVQAIFFVDTTYLIRLLRESKNNKLLRNDFDNVIKQLNHIYKDGHEIFYHLHPHWMDAKYIENKNEWDLSCTKRYSVDALSYEELDELFKQSKDILLNYVSENLSLIAYRSGGLVMKNFKLLIPLFKKYEITHDSSILFNEFILNKSENNLQNIFYKFYIDPFNPDIRGNFYEWPISVISTPSQILKFQEKIERKIIMRLKYQDVLKRGMNANVQSIPKIFLQPPFYRMASFDYALNIHNKMYLKHLFQYNYITFMSHPKLMNSYSVKALDNFLRSVINNFEVETRFRSMFKN